MRPPLALVLVLAAGCGDEPGPGQQLGSEPAQTATSAPPASAAGPASAAPTSMWGDDSPALPPGPPLAEGALEEGASPAERADAVLALPPGGEPATRLPIRATDEGKAFDPALRDEVAPIAKPPRIRMGALEVSPGLPPEVVQRIVRQRFGRFRGCYESALKKEPGLAGTVKTSFAILTDGSVKGVGSTGPAALLGCVAKEYASLSFPQPEGGKAVQVSYELAFAPP